MTQAVQQCKYLHIIIRGRHRWITGHYRAIINESLRDPVHEFGFRCRVEVRMHEMGENWQINDVVLSGFDNRCRCICVCFLLQYFTISGVSDCVSDMLVLVIHLRAVRVYVCDGK